MEQSLSLAAERSDVCRVPLSVTFGRRFVLLVSTLISLGSMVWRAEADSYSSFMGAAVLAGIGTGPGEVRKPELLLAVWVI